MRLRPAPHTRTRIPSYSLKITPETHFINWQQDPHGNWLARLVFPERTTEFSVTVDLTAEMTVINPFDFFTEPYAETMPFAYADDVAGDLIPYLQVDEDGPLLQAAVDALKPAGQGTVNFLVGLNAELQQRTKYLVRMEPGVQTPDETLSLGSGSCRDSAWLLVQMMRKLGLAARFVSGYIYSPFSDPNHRGRIGGGHTHAWVRVYLPACGWVEFDPTNGIVGNTDLVRVAIARDPKQALPLWGSWAGLPSDYLGMDVEVDVHAESEDTEQLTVQRAVGMAS